MDLRPELISLEVEDETVQCKNTRYLDASILGHVIHASYFAYLIKSRGVTPVSWPNWPLSIMAS